MTIERCDKCKFYTDLVKAWGTNSGTGKCNRFPPVIIKIDCGPIKPNVRDNDWCGEFEANREKK